MEKQSLNLKQFNEPISNAKDLHLHAYSLKFQEQDKKYKILVAPLPDFFTATIRKNGFKMT